MHDRVNRDFKSPELAFDVVDGIGSTARADHFQKVDFGKLQRRVIDSVYVAEQCSTVKLADDDPSG
jgi:hypothetical protein